MSGKMEQTTHYTGAALMKKPSPPLPIWEYEFLFKGKVFDGIKSVKTEQTEIIDPYIPDPELVEAIELMRILERPLLLRGEPGCGKTRVAQAVAYELYKNEADYKRYYFEWHVKSSSKAQEGLYTFDHIARLRDAHTPEKKKAGDATTDTTPEKLSEEDQVKYRKLGPLGKAFLASEPDKPAILLIDEIDKADIDFPNDLLLELDQMRFSIPETGEEIIPKRRPLIFITSNQERELPQAFLRRCLFHFIDFPQHGQLSEIIKSNFKEWFEQLEKGKKEEDEVTFISEAITRFEEFRSKLKANPTVNKNLSTSELKDWMRLLEHHYKLGNKEKISLENGNTPFLAALIKTENDRKSLGLNKS